MPTVIKLFTNIEKELINTSINTDLVYISGQCSSTYVRQ